jgi:predicted  nucleic acid-binding Zn-ribbon protein
MSSRGGAVLAELPKLLALQEKDRVITAVANELAAFDPELGALDEELHRGEERLEAARRGITEAGTKRSQLEEKIENFRQMQERRRQRLEWVRGAKEASTLMAELDLGRSVLAREEAEWLRSADRVQEAEAGAAEAERLLQELKDGQAARREEIAARQTECRDRLAVAERERAEVAKTLSRPALVQYERIRRGRAPLALYPMHGGDACGHCYTAVPMHRRQELQAGRRVVMCEACGVLIYNAESVPPAP